ncbi:ROK family protein [Lysinibacillus piscis]|uniref:fructokinase n=1 Tax=Lysinibacillus piscis TaxID=2518931 RepID=A0ABQ5NNJ2_9BACI|nr:ROK family protein [Lysinibacillus sp. KH24]GLC89569.1 putative fructokinase [Lysinibacillus sp. KH24]
MIGAIEAGGTKFVCAVGTKDGKWIERVQFPTEWPEKTMENVIHFFKSYELEAIGVGSFGPCGVDPDKDDFGFITSTPKPGWRSYGIVPALKEMFDVPVGFNTDVNAAALGESMFGAAKGLDSCLYITVGTGIGAGAIVGGKLLQGVSHPEMGHIVVRRHPADLYAGTCPYHKDCLEGLAAGPSLENRYGKKGHQLESNAGVWEMEAYYLAQAITQYILIISPKKVILGGGVMKQRQLYPLIQEKVKAFLNGYVNVPEITERIAEYIVAPELGDNAGITGALLIGKAALEKGG